MLRAPPNPVLASLSSSRVVYGLVLAVFNLAAAVLFSLAEGVGYVAAMPGTEELPSTAGLALLFASVVWGVRFLPGWLAVSTLVVSALLFAFRQALVLRLLLGIGSAALGLWLIGLAGQLSGEPGQALGDTLWIAGWYGIINSIPTWLFRANRSP